MGMSGIVGFWDYGLENKASECINVVLVDEDGAGVLPCATAGDQLRHIGFCSLDGPCNDPK